MTRKISHGDEPRVAGPQRRARDDQLRERGRRAHHLVREGADLALQLFHPVARQLGPVALRIPERPRADVGNPHVGLAAVAIEGAQDRVVRRLAADEPVRRVGVAVRLTRTIRKLGRARKIDLARLCVVPAPDVLDLDLPAQVSRANHDDAQSTA